MSRRPSPAVGRLIAVALLVAGASLPGVWSSPAHAEGVDATNAPPEGCLTSSTVYEGAQPWALRRLSAQRSWPLARGYGVVVAVIGSGIDSGHAQFAPGQVLPGASLLPGGGSADDDCDGSGTFVAGLVAARPHPATSVVGLAPDAQLLPVRVNESIDGSSAPTDADLLAAGIEYARDEGARVIVVSGPAVGPSERLSAAVRSAHDAGAVVVAGGGVESATADPAGDRYPCAIAEAVAVAAVDGDDAVVAGSCSGPTVDLAAPGAGLVSTSAGSVDSMGHVSVDDGAPGYATGYVAGALALMLSYEPGLSGAAAARRLEQTADRPPGGTRDDTWGWGVVNPYAALSAPLQAEESAGAAPGGTVFRRHEASQPADHTVALSAGMALAGAAILVLVTAVTTRAGRRRGWRPGRRTVSTAPARLMP
ncbi:MAG: S8 family serine peptidase [Actinomycetales bacterium]